MTHTHTYTTGFYIVLWLFRNSLQYSKWVTQYPFCPRKEKQYLCETVPRLDPLWYIILVAENIFLLNWRHAKRCILFGAKNITGLFLLTLPFLFMSVNTNQDFLAITIKLGHLTLFSFVVVPIILAFRDVI